MKNFDSLTELASRLGLPSSPRRTDADENGVVASDVVWLGGTDLVALTVYSDGHEAIVKSTELASGGRRTESVSPTGARALFRAAA